MFFLNLIILKYTKTVIKYLHFSYVNITNRTNPNKMFFLPETETSTNIRKRSI